MCCDELREDSIDEGRGTGCSNKFQQMDTRGPDGFRDMDLLLARQIGMTEAGADVTKLRTPQR